MISIEEVSETLAAMKCSEHSKHPEIEREGETLKLTTCCDEFAIVVNEECGRFFKNENHVYTKRMIRQ